MTWGSNLGATITLAAAAAALSACVNSAPEADAEAVAAPVVAITVAALESAGATLMSEAQIANLVVDQTVTHANALDQRRTYTYYATDGASYLFSEGNAYPTRYAIGDGLRCRINLSNEMECSRLYQAADRVWVCPDDPAATCEWWIEETVPGRSPPQFRAQ